MYDLLLSKLSSALGDDLSRGIGDGTTTTGAGWQVAEGADQVGCCGRLSLDVIGLDIDMWAREAFAARKVRWLIGIEDLLDTLVVGWVDNGRHVEESDVFPRVPGDLTEHARLDDGTIRDRVEVSSPALVEGLVGI